MATDILEQLSKEELVAIIHRQRALVERLSKKLQRRPVKLQRRPVMDHHVARVRESYPEPVAEGIIQFWREHGYLSE